MAKLLGYGTEIKSSKWGRGDSALLANCLGHLFWELIQAIQTKDCNIITGTLKYMHYAPLSALPPSAISLKSKHGF